MQAVAYILLSPGRTMGYCTNVWIASRCLLIVVGLGTVSLFQGCASTPAAYYERHVLKGLTVVFLDPQSLHSEWKTLSGRQPIVFASHTRGGLPTVQTLLGFYDVPSNTLYCPKWNFEVCGHELHHAVLGQFHSD